MSVQPQKVYLVLEIVMLIYKAFVFTFSQKKYAILASFASRKDLCRFTVSLELDGGVQNLPAQPVPLQRDLFGKLSGRVCRKKTAAFGLET